SGINAVADETGIIAAAAMDQRGSLKKAIAKARGGDASSKDLSEFKIQVTEVLTRYASAILLDPEYGLEAVKHRAPNAGVLLAYDDKIGEEKSFEFARVKPTRVKEYMQEFSKPGYGVDVLKVEIPVNMAYVAGTKANKEGKIAYSREEAKQFFRDAAAASQVPFIYLSAGVSNEVFLESLELATEADTPFAGVLCGRATWQDGIPVYAKGGSPLCVVGLRIR